MPKQQGVHRDVLPDDQLVEQFGSPSFFKIPGASAAPGDLRVRCAECVANFSSYGDAFSGTTRWPRSCAATESLPVDVLGKVEEAANANLSVQR
ncbi:hypothetical protein [Nocardia asiatica]|uniref:hypothetical protein n=1 Tax=Nocardia asiatica TaxID=209252 RepID=UPI002455B485|nr:hypothetical protein [Nocardia asiatica]